MEKTVKSATKKVYSIVAVRKEWQQEFKNCKGAFKAVWYLLHEMPEFSRQCKAAGVADENEFYALTSEYYATMRIDQPRLDKEGKEIHRKDGSLSMNRPTTDSVLRFICDKANFASSMHQAVVEKVVKPNLKKTAKKAAKKAA